MYISILFWVLVISHTSLSGGISVGVSIALLVRKLRWEKWKVEALRRKTPLAPG